KVGLSAEVPEPAYVVTNRTDRAPCRVLVTNNDPEAITLTKMISRCGCVKVDETVLPRTIPPRGRMEFTIPVAAKADGAPQNLSLDFESDRGPRRIRFQTRVFPGGSISPDALQAGRAAPGEKPEFKVRTVEIAAGAIPAATLTADDPAAVTFQEVGRREGEGPIEGYRFREIDYVGRVVSDAPGLHAKTFRLQRDVGVDSYAGVTVHWERVDHVAAIPAKAYLSDRPVKLRLLSAGPTKIVDVKTGSPHLRAVTTDDGRIEVSAVDDAPDRFEAEVVATVDHPKQAVVKIPVVRWKLPAASTVSTAR
ncbi:MAG: hypothetical protein ACRDD1_00420, partial [Planctomycetia bacterium]